MTQQPDPGRSAALRELLVDVASGAPAPWREGVVLKRTALVAAAVSVGAVVLVVAFQATPNEIEEAVPAEPPGHSVTGPSAGVGARVKMYASLEELISDSGAVVVGVIADQQPGDDGTTIVTLEVERSFTPAALGSTSPEPPVPVTGGSVIRVRTFGGAVTSLPSAPLETGGRYLLFLTPTGLPSAGDDEFFVTGVVAGIYKAQGDGFARDADDGDDLPAELRESDLE